MRSESLLLRLAAAAILPAALSFSQPSAVGQFEALINTELVPIHVILLPTGKILYWDRHDQGTHDMTPRLWDPATKAITKTPAPSYDLFCSGHAFLRNGDVMMVGGHIQDFVGENKLSVYNTKAGTWDQTLPQMNAGRWYPTATTLANGDVLMVSGDVVQSQGNPLPQIWDYRARKLRTLDSANLPLPWYPYMYVASKDKAFMAGPDAQTRMLDLRGRGAWTDVAKTNSGLYRNYGSSVMYEPGKIMICGGAITPPTASVELIDINAPAPAWKNAESMKYARRHHTATMLPDGTVLVTGGTSGSGDNNAGGAVFNAEMFDPRTGHWTTWAAAKVLRIYHSIAILMPDGRVLTGGGGHPGDPFEDAHPDFEYFDPPYLFKGGARPAIGAAPDTLYYGGEFTVSTASTSIAQVTLLKNAAMTHAFNQNQDFNRLSFTKVAGGLKVKAPADSILTTPGPHMLFLLDSAGVPSTAKILFVTTGPGSNGVRPGASAPRIGMASTGDRLVISGAALEGGAVCRLSDVAGRRVMRLARGEGESFLVPAGLRGGTYIATLRADHREISAKIILP